MYKLEYSSNNSGGRWWLEDKDWHAMERAGWIVDWYDPEEEYDYSGATKGVKRYPDGRFLDALASRAHKIVGSKAEASEAIEEFERITHQNATASGCNCCGQPHYFSLYKTEVPCSHEWQKEGEICYSCDDTGFTDEFVSSFDVSPKHVEYNRSWD